MKDKFSSGLDGISNSLIKLSSDVLSKPPTLITNQTLTSCEDSCVPNYRPIFLLPSLS